MEADRDVGVIMKLKNISYDEIYTCCDNECRFKIGYRDTEDQTVLCYDILNQFEEFWLRPEEVFEIIIGE